MGNTHTSPIVNKVMLEKDGVFELSLDATQLKAGLLPLARIPDVLTGKDADTLDSYDAGVFASLLTVAVFQGFTPTGTAQDPTYINDDLEDNYTGFDTVGKYVEVDFTDPYLIRRFRFMGVVISSGEGRFKIQHWDGSAWVDNTVGIVNRGLTWSDWADLSLSVSTTKIRIIATVLDVTLGENTIAEFEIIG